jgi:hypothetical protein
MAILNVLVGVVLAGASLGALADPSSDEGTVAWVSMSNVTWRIEALQAGVVPEARLTSALPLLGVSAGTWDGSTEVSKTGTGTAGEIMFGSVGQPTGAYAYWESDSDSVKVGFSLASGKSAELSSWMQSSNAAFELAPFTRLVVSVDVEAFKDRHHDFDGSGRAGMQVQSTLSGRLQNSDGLIFMGGYSFELHDVLGPLQHQSEVLSIVFDNTTGQQAWGEVGADLRAQAIGLVPPVALPPVPEPATYLLLAVGLCIIGAATPRQKTLRRGVAEEQHERVGGDAAYRAAIHHGHGRERRTGCL